jgi:c-di-GMP-binding flagellar brake protein YcgR
LHGPQHRNRCCAWDTPAAFSIARNTALFMADASASSEQSRFRIDSELEIAYILRGLMKSNAHLTAYLSGGHFVMSSVLKVDAERRIVVLDGAPSPELNERVLDSRDFKVESFHDGVKVQFEVHTVEEVTYEGRPAFRIPLPNALIKMQRREYYRMPTPLLRQVKCEVPCADGSRAQLPVSDISLGGLCLVGQPPQESWEVGALLKGCRIELPDEGTLEVNLCIRNSYQVRLKNDSSVSHTGCQFIELGARQEAAVQRYIIKLERERRAKGGDRR